MQLRRQETVAAVHQSVGQKNTADSNIALKLIPGSNQTCSFKLYVYIGDAEQSLLSG